MPGPELLLQTVQKSVPLESEEQQRLLVAFQKGTFPRKEFFLRSGEVCKQVAFVLQGCLRSYAVDEEGTEHNLQFAPEGWWITDMNSILYNQPAQLNIEAIEDTQALLMNREQQELLFRDLPILERFFRIITEKSMAGSHKRLIEQVSVNAKDRYIHFCKLYPELIQRLPQKQIASYIGVTPEFLSKIKSELLKGKS
ncbi:MAG TPA: Crp/Fnr family transcriptional regulator [Bacteroidia bacterium]|nr:Crp/Fnr family transcriptional regulator [Bacteroidia bacterium]